ncbi:MAG: hypothetical protein JXP34_04610, partial [Planctomycetes bacterium]|nr:hypothetical protein [Planctomycetota bacterium]
MALWRFDRDRAWVRRAVRGDGRAFQVLFERYSRRLHVLAFSYVADYHLAEDIVQEAFVQAFDRLTTLRQEDLFGPWISAITTNLSRRALHKKSHGPTEQTGGRVLQELVSPGSAGDD